MEFGKRQTVWQILASEKYVKWTLLIPLLVVLGVFMFYPLFYCLYMSFQKCTLRHGPDFLGLDNYRKLLHNPVFWRALGRTGYILVVSISIELTIGMGIALLFNREFKGQGVVRGLCLLPLLIAPLTMSMIWNYMLHYQVGIVNQVLSWLGLARVEWLANPRIALYSIMLMSIWQWTPFSIFVLLAGLRGLPKDALEAARVDGASRWFTFRKLILSMLTPLIIIIILLRTMWLMRIYDPLFGTTHGGLKTEVIDWMLYRISFTFFDVGKGATMGLVCLFITIIISVILFRQLIKALGAAR